MFLIFSASQAGVIRGHQLGCKLFSGEGLRSQRRCLVTDPEWSQGHGEGRTVLSTCGESHMKYLEWVTCRSTRCWVKIETLEGPRLGRPSIESQC